MNKPVSAIVGFLAGVATVVMVALVSGNVAVK